MFEHDAEFDRQPGEFDKGVGDVLPEPGLRENYGSRVLNVVESVHCLCWQTKEDGIAIVQAGDDMLE